MADGKFRYSVFRAADGKRCVVIMNMEEHKPITTKLDLPNAGALVVATPEQQEAQSTSAAVNIPPRFAAVIMEKLAA